MSGAFAIVVTEKGGEQRTLDFDKGEVTIGRVQGNDIVLGKGNVSKRHARIVIKDGKFIIVDLKSTNGTYVNGRKITSPLVIKPADKIYIGDFILGVEEPAAESVSPLKSLNASAAAVLTPPPDLVQPPPPLPPPVTPPPVSVDPIVKPVDTRTSRVAPDGPGTEKVEPPVTDSKPDRLAASRPSRVKTDDAGGVGLGRVETKASGSANIQTQAKEADKNGVDHGRSRERLVHPPTPAKHANLTPLQFQGVVVEHVVEKLGLAQVAHETLGDEALWQRTETAIAEYAKELGAAGTNGAVDGDALVRDALNEALGLGPLEELLEDLSVQEIVVDRPDRILVHRSGQIVAAERSFSSFDALVRVVRRLIASAGTEQDTQESLVDVRLRDGSRLTAAFPPVAVHGPCFVLQKPAQSMPGGLAALVSEEVLSASMADFLTLCVEANRNILVCGLAGGGTETLVGALAAAIPAGKRIVSFEHGARLALDREGWIALNAPPEASDETTRKLIRSARGLRPDRLIVTDVASGEAYDLISTMANGCPTIASIIGDGPDVSLARLIAKGRLATAAPTDALRELTASAVDVVVHVVRRDNKVRVLSISELLAATADGFRRQPLFELRGQTGNQFVPAGIVPQFYAELKANGLVTNADIFRT